MRMVIVVVMMGMMVLIWFIEHVCLKSFQAVTCLQRPIRCYWKTHCDAYLSALATVRQRLEHSETMLRHQRHLSHTVLVIFLCLFSLFSFFFWATPDPYLLRSSRFPRVAWKNMTPLFQVTCPDVTKINLPCFSDAFISFIRELGSAPSFTPCATLSFSNWVNRSKMSPNHFRVSSPFWGFGGGKKPNSLFKSVVLWSESLIWIVI